MSDSPYASPARRFDVVFCDVDGCLLPEVTTPADLHALARVAEHNERAVTDRDRPVVVPCTGRPQPFTEAVCKMLGRLDNLPAICEHGVWLYEFERHAWSLAPDITPEDVRVVREVEDWVRDELAESGCVLELGKHAGVTIVHPDVEYLTRAVLPVLEARIAERGWPLHVAMTWTCINANLRHVSKGHAIARVIERWRLDPARTAGIGDTIGDLAIRQRVAWFGCPANAAPDIKPHADAVAARPEAEGVLELLEMVSG